MQNICRLPAACRPLLLAGFLLLVGCNESDFLVARDDDEPPQVLIITRDVSGDPRGDSEEASATFPPSSEIDPMRLLWVQTYETEWTSNAYTSARASFWALIDSATAASASFESVMMGGQALPLLDSVCEENSESDELCWVIEMAGRPLDVFAADADIEAFTDAPRFEATGSSQFQNVDVELNIPSSNRMSNVSPGMRVEAGRDWTIHFDRAVDSPVVFIRPAAGDYDSGYKRGAETNLYLSIDGAADRLTVPRAELERLRSAGAEMLWVSLYVTPAARRLDSVLLERIEGGESLEVGVAMSSFHNVWGVQLTD